MKKLFRLFSSIVLLAVAAYSTNASAVVVIDFGTGEAGAGGTLTPVGTDVVGADILIGALSVTGTSSSDGVYITDAVLNFDTAADTISIVGGVADLGIGAGTTLLTGSYTSFDFQFDAGTGSEIFSASGPDTKARSLLDAIGVDPATPFEFFGITIEAANGNVTSTDFVNTAVPVPAAVWLFGSGLLGLVGVARRRA
jgi:hypothetical protein